MPAEEQQDKLRETALQLAENIHSHMMRLGDVLAAINAGRFYHDWGFSTWKEYVEVEIRTSVTASYEMVNVSRWAQEQGLTLAERRALADVGRRKAYCISHLATKQTLKTWLGIAKKSTIEDMRSRMYGEDPEDSPKGVTFWLQGPQRKVVRRAVSMAEEHLGEGALKGDVLSEICHYYVLGKTKAKRLKTARAKSRKTKKKPRPKSKKKKKTAAK